MWERKRPTTYILVTQKSMEEERIKNDVAMKVFFQP
jgi:hypothetical protein